MRETTENPENIECLDNILSTEEMSTDQETDFVSTVNITA